MAATMSKSILYIRIGICKGRGSKKERMSEAGTTPQLKANESFVVHQDKETVCPLASHWSRIHTQIFGVDLGRA